jgi:septal ring factor EnvC (AmiA/AmiB activator)
MNNILNKIAQMERNAAELKSVELAKHEINLGMFDTLKTNINVDNKNIAELEKMVESIKKSANELGSKLAAADRGALTTAKQYDKIVETAKELGIGLQEINSSKEVQEMEKNGVRLTEVLRYVQKIKG